MKLLRIAAIALVLYAGIVAAFESLIGYFQPSDASTLVLTTFDAEGTAHERVVSRLESDGKLYVAVNHWPRAWYHRALERPEVQATIGGQRADYRAVPVSGSEHERVDAEHPLGAFVRILVGFAPRYFVRLDPR
jgi:hypothetical protein